MIKAFGVLALLATSSLTGCVALQRDVDIKNEAFEKEIQAEHADNAKLRSDLDATRERLDNALRANADTGSDVMSSKARLNELAGRTEELAHSIDEVKKDVASSRTELETRIDDMKRAQVAMQTPLPPPIVIPEGKTAHFEALEAAYAKKDFGLVRTLGHEYTLRYPTAENTDEAFYLMGDGDLQDGRPSSALGEFNRLLKLFPHSKKLDITLYDMGSAYLLLHDCVNARLAFSTCEARYPKAKAGGDSKREIAKIDHPSPGTCAPP